MTAKRALKNARRKARQAKRVNPRPSRTEMPRESSSYEGLEALLRSRGWIVFDRAARGTMYDWPPSTDADGEVTCLIVDAVAGEEGRYRVRCVDGERRKYDDAEALVADLDHIEAIRA